MSVCFVGECWWLSHAISQLCLPLPLSVMSSLSCGQEGPARRKGGMVHCLCCEIRGHIPTLLWASWRVTSSHPAYLAIACFVYLKWAEGKSNRLPYYLAQCWINESELIHKSASPKIFSSFIACSTMYSELLLLHSSIWSILKYPPRLIYLDSTVHFLHIYSWSSYNCWLEIHQIQI